MKKTYKPTKLKPAKFIIIGKYVICEDGWITIINDGEGGKFDLKEIEKVIDKFYKENF
jgi:hypothetical protein